MLVGWGGNNGSTVTGGIIANKHNITWRTQHGVQKPNYYGSLTQVHGMPFLLQASALFGCFVGDGSFSG
jgi:hypothetical protein